jgi:hypothetical protein
MSKESRIEPVLIPKEKWIKIQDPPKGVLEGHHYGVNWALLHEPTSLNTLFGV